MRPRVHRSLTHGTEGGDTESEQRTKHMFRSWEWHAAIVCRSNGMVRGDVVAGLMKDLGETCCRHKSSLQVGSTSMILSIIHEHMPSACKGNFIDFSF